MSSASTSYLHLVPPTSYVALLAFQAVLLDFEHPQYMRLPYVPEAGRAIVGVLPIVAWHPSIFSALVAEIPPSIEPEFADAPDGSLCSEQQITKAG
jgi:hypothetical protein